MKSEFGISTENGKKTEEKKQKSLIRHVGEGAVFVFNEALGQVVELQEESRSRVNVDEF